MGRRVSIVPHTHWDREWYRPFQSFRMRLVDLVDGLLPRLESDPAYTHFMLDGQMAVVDDYLEIRPEAEERIRRLATSGRLAVGPWYILMDEFLVSGETIIRDLELGLARAAEFGGAMPVGYLPDMFGHIAQMPQILQQFAFADAVVWRGVPGAVDRSAFWWEAPDGSRVRAEYLVDGYSNGATLPPTGTMLVDEVNAWCDRFADLLGDADVLWMNGTDHLMPQPWLGRVVDEANALDSHDYVVASLAEHVARGPRTGLPTHRGELRSGARANLLMGVTSNRVDVRQAAARVERAIEQVAEPLCALYLSEWPASFLDAAWLEVIRNAAHDSICACSHDDVVAAVLHRYAEAEAIAEGLARRALKAIARAQRSSAPVIVNPSARARGGIVQLRAIPAPPGAQIATERDGRVSYFVRVADVPGFGWAPATAAVGPPATADALRLANDLVDVTIDPSDGTFSIGDHRGLGRLVDGGDSGDTYNYNPPASDVVIDTPLWVTTHVLDRGPVVARVVIRRGYQWPTGHDPGRDTRIGAVEVEIVTILELRTGEEFVRIEFAFENGADDHRLRAHFRLPRPASHSRAECAFTVVTRGLEAEGGPTELPLPTYPSRRFVSAGGLTLAHEGLPEYELVDLDDGHAHELAVTLLRATRMLSRGPMRQRPLPAGPDIELRGSQVPGPHRLRLAVTVDAIDPYALVDDAFNPLLVATGEGTGDAAATGSALTIDGAQVSAVRRVAGALEVRLFNPTDTPTTATIAHRSGWLVDLRGRGIERFDESISLGPHAIVTARM